MARDPNALEVQDTTASINPDGSINWPPCFSELSAHTRARATHVLHQDIMIYGFFTPRALQVVTILIARALQNKKEVEPDSVDVDIVMSQVNVTRDVATDALKRADGDVVHAIMDLNADSNVDI